MPCGMIFGLLTHVARKFKILHDDNHGNLFSTRLSLSAILLSIIGIGGYCIFSVYCRSQQECLEIHAYVGFIPVNLIFMFISCNQFTYLCVICITSFTGCKLYYSQKYIRNLENSIFNLLCLVWTILG